MFCPKCGKPIDEGNLFCIACGHKVPLEQPEAQEEQVQEVQPVQEEQPVQAEQPIQEEQFVQAEQPIQEEQFVQEEQLQPEQSPVSDASVPFEPQQEMCAVPKPPKKRVNGLLIGIISVVLVILLCTLTVFGLQNELRYLIKPSWQVEILMENTFDDLEKESLRLSRTLLGFDATEKSSTATAQVSIMADGQKIDIRAVSTASDERARMKLNLAANGNTLADAILNWDDEEISISIPQINDNRYYIPVDNFRQTWNNSAFAQSLDAQIPDTTYVPYSLSYEEMMDSSEDTREQYEACCKRFIRRLQYGTRTKSTLMIDGKNRNVHCIETTVTAGDLVAFLEDLVNISGVPLPPEVNPEELKSMAASATENVTLQLIEHKNRFIGINVQGLLFYFNNTNLLDGFVAEAAGYRIELVGDSQMKDGTLDYALNANGLGNTQQLMYFCLDNNNGTFHLNVEEEEMFRLNNVKCGNGITIGSNDITLDGATLSFSLSVQKGEQKIEVSGKPENLLTKTVSEWENILMPDFERFARTLQSQFGF